MKNLLITTVGSYNHANVWKNGKSNYDVLTIDYRLRRVFKFPGIHEELTTRKRLDYDYYFMPDEDIYIEVDQINELFESMLQYELDIAQPSIEKSARSFPSWEQFVHIDGVGLVYTEFVEVMCPCFSKRAIDFILETFPKSNSGWGLDLAWAKIAKDKGFNMAIINNVVALHTRNVKGGSLYEVLRANGVSPSRERKKIMAEYGIKSIKEFIHD